MHIKFLRAGRSGQKAVAYLLKKRAAEEVIVRRGDPVFFADLVDSLGYKSPYSSAVIAFAPEDEPTEEQIEEVIKGFQRTAWAGLQDDDFCILVVEHRQKDGKKTHLHFLVANYHISRKRYFNPAPPGWQKRYDLLRDYLNSKYGWARPDDEKRARKVQPGYLAFPGVAAEKRQVLAWAEALAEMGLGLEEIAEVALASGAEVTRKGTDYVTLAWGRQRVRVRTEKKEKKEEKKEVDAVTIEEQERRWQSALDRLATKNRERYEQKGERENGRRNRTSVTDAGRDCVPGVQARSAAGAESRLGPRNLVVLPFASRLGLGRRPGGRIPRKLQRLGGGWGVRITRGMTRGRNGIRIQWAFAESSRTACSGSREPESRSREPETPAGGVRGHDAAHHGGTSGAAPAAGGPGAGMAGRWAALERALRRLGVALERASAAARSLCASVEGLYRTARRLVAAGGGMRQERGAEQAEQPAARREEPRADVPRPGWPPGRWQGPGWG